MKNKENRKIRHFQNSRTRGSSLPLVICVAAFMLAFSLALVYTAGLMMSRAGKKVEQERCCQLASTFARQLDRELKKDKSSFQEFVNKFLSSSAYNEYNPENPSTVYHYIAEDNVDDSYGVIKVRLYKELNEEEQDTLSGYLQKVNDNANFTTVVEERQNQTFQRYIFTVEVIAQLGELSYNYSTEYFRQDKYRVVFSHNGMTIVWDGSEWKEGDMAGAVYEGWKGSEEPIQYQYLIEENPISVKYRNVHAEPGMETDADAQGGV